MNVVLYARVSSEAQDVSLSISAQLKALREYAERNGHVIVREFVDEAETGRSITKRPAFREMIALANSREKPFSAVLIWKFSRFARNRADSIVYKTLLRKHDVQVISITEPAENSPTGRLMEAIIEGMDEYYSDNLGEEVTRGMRESVSRGFYLSSKAPYGYRKIHVQDSGKLRTKLEIDQSQSPIVVGIFNDIVAGQGLIQIVKNLNQKGIAGPKGKGWSKTGLRAITKNEIYTGTFVWGRNSRRGNQPIRAEGAFPAIISKEQFLKVQQLMGERTITITHPRRTGSRFLLSGLAFCGHCGKALIGQDAKSGKFSYYVCGSLGKKGAGSCKATYLNSGKLEKLVVSKIKEHILTSDNLAKLVDLVNEEMDFASSSHRVEIDTVQKELGDVNRRLSNVYNAIENGDVDYVLLKPRLVELKTQHDKLLARQAELESLISKRKIELAEPEVVKEYVEELRRFLDGSDLLERRAFIKGFIKEVNVKGNGGLIKYALPLPPDNIKEENLKVLPIVQYSGQ